MALPPTDAPFIGWNWDIVQSGDFNDALPPLHYSGAPIDLTGLGLQLYIRPTYDYPTPIAVLSSGGIDPNIIIDDAANGLVTVYVPQATVETWEAGEWEFFLRVNDGLTSEHAEVASGPFRIHARDDSLA